MTWDVRFGDLGDEALLERGDELAMVDEALERTGAGGSGSMVLVEGPAGIGKTTLLGELGRRAAAGHRVLRARGSEIERDFGFGVVRQLLGPILRSLDPAGRARIFAGPAALAAAIFGMADGGGLDVSPAEASLYGLFWLLAGLVEREPLVFVVDDAHWSDIASLRFVQYLGRRLDGLPLLVALGARPHEPGAQAEMLRGVVADLDLPTIAPGLLSEAATARIVRAHLGGASTAPIEAACHRASGGNPLLIEELLAELDLEAAASGEISADAIAAMGPKRIGDGVIARARALDQRAPELVRAVAVLGDGADLPAIAALAGIDPGAAAPLVDGLDATSILAGEDGGYGFAHPLLGAAVNEQIPAAGRESLHAAAADLLRSRGAEAEEVAAHLLLCSPGSTVDALAVLDAAARQAADRGAPDSAVTYLRRALPEVAEPEARGRLLHRLGSAEVSLRDPASIGHLGEAAELSPDPGRALDISLELIEVLAIAGQWEAAVAAVDSAAARFGGSELPGLAELEAVRAAYRGYDPAWVADYDRDLPRLREMVRGRQDRDSTGLRWVLAGIGTMRDAPRDEVLELVGPVSSDWTTGRGGRESSLVSHAAFSLLMVDALEDGERVGAMLLEDGRRRGSLISIVTGVGFSASLEARRGQLAPSEASLSAVIELIEENDLSLMALTTVVHFCIDTILERRQLEWVADLVEGLEVPPPFGRTYSGALALEARAAVRAARGDRAGALADMREVEKIVRPLRIGPRAGCWRSRLALLLPDAARAEALALLEQELALATAVDSPRARGVALRALGVFSGGEAGGAHLVDSIAALRECPSDLEVARSLADLGANLRRGNRRNEARERLREAADLAQRCGAERLERRIEEEARIAGGKPRRRAVSGPESLTPAERRVAAAAAAGASNREIAQSLFVSLRTVEMHLTNTYRKLDNSSRADLAKAIGLDPDESRSAA